MTGDPRIEVAAQALADHWLTGFGDETRCVCRGWHYEPFASVRTFDSHRAAAAVAAVDDHDLRQLADLLVSRYGKAAVMAVDASALNQFEFLATVVERGLRERIAREVLALASTRQGDPLLSHPEFINGWVQALHHAARIARGQETHA